MQDLSALNCVGQFSLARCYLRRKLTWETDVTLCSMTARTSLSSGASASLFLRQATAKLTVSERQECPLWVHVLSFHVQGSTVKTETNRKSSSKIKI